MIGMVLNGMWKKIYKNLQLRGDVWLFCLFLVMIPFSIRKVVWFLPLQGGFNEYADTSLYASDLLLMSVFVCWYYINSNTSAILSIDRMVSIVKMSRVSLAHKLSMLLPAAIIVWSGCSLIYAQQLSIGFFFVCKLIEWYGMLLFVVFRIVPRRTIGHLKWQNMQLVLKSLIFSGLLQAIIGILQVIYQRSLGLMWLRESVIDPYMPGIAKVIFHNEAYIRAYGMLPHPNILGGFLLVSIIITYLYLKLFHVKQNRIGSLYGFVLVVQYLGIALTVSKSAIMGLCVAILYIFFVSHGTTKRQLDLSGHWRRIAKGDLFVKRVAVIVLAGGIVMVFLWFALRMFDRDALLFQSLRERVWYQNIALDIIHNYPILGISCGQLVFFMSQQHVYPLLSWQLQPVHNVFLLIWSELGVVGFGLFSLWWILFLGMIPCRQRECFQEKKNAFARMDDGCRWNYLGVYVYGMIVGLLPILLLDHYLWDIQQGQFVLWFVMSVFIGYILNNKHYFLASNES